MHVSPELSFLWPLMDVHEKQSFLTIFTLSHLVSLIFWRKFFSDFFRLSFEIFYFNKVREIFSLTGTLFLYVGFHYFVFFTFEMLVRWKIIHETFMILGTCIWKSRVLFHLPSSDFTCHNSVKFSSFSFLYLTFFFYSFNSQLDCMQFLFYFLSSLVDQAAS